MEGLMTAAEMRKLLAALPDHTQLCYSAGGEKGTILEVSQVAVVRVVGDSDGCFAEDDGAISIAVMA